MTGAEDVDTTERHGELKTGPGSLATLRADFSQGDGGRRRGGACGGQRREGGVDTREGSGVRLQHGRRRRPLGPTAPPRRAFSLTRVGPQVGNFALEFQEILPVDMRFPPPLSTPRAESIVASSSSAPSLQNKNAQTSKRVQTISACVQILCER